MKILLDEKKPFYKANLHCHSTYSDGKMTVQEIKNAYVARGYSIVAFTDHEYLVDNSCLNDENFLSLTGCEIAIKQFPTQSTMKNYSMQVCHLCLYALDPHNVVTPCYSSQANHFTKPEHAHLVCADGDKDRCYDVAAVNELIKTANERGFLVGYNHPSWSLEDATRYLQYEGLFSVEIFNTNCVQTGLPTDERVFDDMLHAGKRIYCTAADDNHNQHGLTVPTSDSFGGWVCINAEKLEYAAVMTALQNGCFYASTGPSIFSLIQEGNKVKICCSPCRSISLIPDGRNAQTIRNENLTEAEFTLSPNSKYFRLRITDEKGNNAYTQAYYI